MESNGNQSSSRRKRSGMEKLKIVLQGMQGNVDVSELCRREDIQTSQYYAWKKKLLSSANRIYQEKPEGVSRREEKLTRDLSRLKDVVAEITLENLELKKPL